MFLSDNQGSRPSHTKTEWSISDQGLKNNITEKTYERDRLSYILKKDGYKGVASIFYDNEFLCNLTTLYSQSGIYEYHGFKEDNTLVNYSNTEHKLIDLNNIEFHLTADTLIYGSKNYGVAGLRALENSSSYEVMFYGKYLMSVNEDVANVIKNSKDVYLNNKLNYVKKKLSNNDTVTEAEKIKKELKSKNYKIIRSPNEVILTTETASNLNVVQRLGVITAECAYGMNIFKDLFASISDIFGGRNKSIQNTLKDARKNVLAELQKEAFSLGANAVVGIDLDYSEISGGGKFGMLFIVASGTAVIIER